MVRTGPGTTGGTGNGRCVLIKGLNAILMVVVRVGHWWGTGVGPDGTRREELSQKIACL